MRFSLLCSFYLFVNHVCAVRKTPEWPLCVFIASYIIQGIHTRMERFQKLTRNLFLTLHSTTYTISSSNYPSFSCATSSSLLMLTAGPVSKMASQQEKALCVLLSEVPRSVITVQLEFRARFRKDAPCRNNITRWY